MAAPARNFAQDDEMSALDQRQIVQFLNKSIGWYQGLEVERRLATTPSDLLFANDDRPLADQIVRLAFDFARACAPLLNSQPALGAQATTDSRQQALMKTAAKLEDQSNQTRAQLETLKQKLAKGSLRQRKATQAAVAETESELSLLQVRRDAVRSMLQFMGGAIEPGGLASQVETLERSVLGLTSDNPSAGRTSAGDSAAFAAASARPLQSSGIWGLLRDIFSLSGKIRSLDATMQQTDNLLQTAKQMQLPLRGHLRELIRQADTLTNQPDSHDPAALMAQKNTLDALTAQFKLIAAAALPLSKQVILLNVYKKNLDNWHASIRSDYSVLIKSLLVRFLGLAVLLAIVLGIFELWRRAIYRYILDSRRRYQFLLLRRIALWFVIAMVVAFGFVSELGSLATFAGLLTAGVAVALQNVILAVVGYFLLIGKFGVRVGDRVQVAGVTGEVVEIGLIRLHVMELAGIGADARPTGRVVAFSNSIVFQPTAGLFKQVPGTGFLWHEISFTLAGDSDYTAVEQRMHAAVDVAFKDYQKDLEHLRRQMEHNLSSVSITSLAPRVRLRRTAAGLDVVLRFPVEANKADEVDDRVSREFLHAIEQEPKLKVVGGDGVPTIRLKSDATAPSTTST